MYINKKKFNHSVIRGGKIRGAQASSVPSGVKEYSKCDAIGFSGPASCGPRLMPIRLVDRAAHSAAVPSATKLSLICQPRPTRMPIASGPTKEPIRLSPITQPMPVERMAAGTASGEKLPQRH